MSDVGVRKMITRAKQRGYVTYDELNKVLPSDKTSSEQIEDTMAMLNEMGINVIESEEPGRGERRREVPALAEGGKGARQDRRSRASNMTAPTIRCACICARWVRSSCCRAKAKSPSPSASRPAAN
jgi:RNA polymerase primary sigma factor